MTAITGLTSESTRLLSLRGLSTQESADFAALLGDAQQAMDDGKSAKQVLKGMSQEELTLVQRASSLADPINVSGLSKEGATNLLAQPDYSDHVDLDNDGIVEVGKARTVTFPPVNAPQHVKDAWDEATEGMSEFDKATVGLNMHFQIYGIEIEGVPQKEPLSPEAQWSELGVRELMESMRAALDFAVGMDGWTQHRVAEKAIYDRFEGALA